MGGASSSAASTPRVRESCYDALMPLPTPRRKVRNVTSIKVSNGVLSCVNDDTFDLQDARDVAKHIRAGTAVEVALLNCEVSDPVVLELVEALGSDGCTTLITFQLSGCRNVTDVSSVPLLRWLIKYADSLRVLSLSRTSITNRSLAVLSKSIIRHPTSLRRLWLCGLDNITDTGLSQLTSSLRFCPEIELNCSGCINVSTRSLLALTSSEYVDEKNNLLQLKALTYRRWQTWALTTAGYRHLKRNRLDEARGCFLEATRVSPDSSQAAFGMAAMCFMSGRGRQASMWNARAASLAVKRVQRKYDKYQPSASTNNNNNSNNNNNNIDTVASVVTVGRVRRRRIRWTSDVPPDDDVSANGAAVVVLAAAAAVIVPSVAPTPSFKVISTFAVQAAQAALTRHRGRYEDNDTADDSH